MPEDNYLLLADGRMISAGRWLKKDQSHANRPIFAGRWRKNYQLSAVDSLRGKEIRSLRPVWQEGIHGMPGEVGEETEGRYVRDRQGARYWPGT